MKKNNLTYLDALPEDFELLAETAISSKGKWGYSKDLLFLWKNDLEITKLYIEKNKVVKVYLNHQFIGFFGLKFINEYSLELDHLWLLPEFTNKGCGRSIFIYIFDFIQSIGYKRMTLIAEPNAKGFYEKMGGNIIGNYQSLVTDRFIDIYEFDVNVCQILFSLKNPSHTNYYFMH